MTKLVSRPLLSQRMFPPWLSTISLAMASPSPAPPVREERAGVQPVELLEDVGQLPLGDLQPLVSDGDLRLTPYGFGLNVHPAAGGGVADGVAQHVIKDPGKFVRVSQHH